MEHIILKKKTQIELSLNRKPNYFLMDLKFHPLSVRYFKRAVTGITDELSVNE